MQHLNDTHITEARLALYFEDKLSVPDRRDMELHLADCSLCTERLADIVRAPEILQDPSAPTLDRALLDRAMKLAPTPATVQRPLWSYPATRWGFAFVGLLLVGVGMTFLLSPAGPDTSEFRSTQPEAVQQTMIPADETAVTTPAVGLRWSRLDNAVGYHVFVYDAGGTILWTTSLVDSEVAVPSSASMPPGRTYLWRVETIFRDGSSHRSSLHAFTYSPAAVP